jgi:hypothetical protein
MSVNDRSRRRRDKERQRNKAGIQWMEEGMVEI